MIYISMHQNIKINNTKSIDAKLYSANYYDFMLYKGGTISCKLDNISLADFSMLNIDNGILYSSVSWSGATNNGVKMNDVGFTGMDNGLISFDKHRITNDEFMDLLLNSEYIINSGDTRLFLTPVNGNTQLYEYPLFLYENNNEKYIVCKGGFYQGFFKLYGHDYQVLPHKIDNEWLMHFNIRPRSDYGINEKTVNYTHKNNSGIFFFMGIRSENKFWEHYKTDSSVTSTMLKNDVQTDGYFNDNDNYNSHENNVVFHENNWIMDEIDSSNIGCHNNTNLNAKKFVSEDYIGTGLSISERGYVDSYGYQIEDYSNEKIISDNKFLMFDRTPSGFTIDTWIEGTKVVLENKQRWPNANYFLLMDRTSSGYTVDTIDEYNKLNEYPYDIYDDIIGNVFALRIKEDGSIGYRYGVFDCVEKYKLLEEYSKPNMVKNNEWNSINVKFSLINKRYMKIYIYVNGFLVFVSKEVNSFNFKHIIKESVGKQETVPFNISLGGGSLGLLESINPNYFAISKYILPIEQDFCGTFIGDIKSFKIEERL